MNPDQKQQVRVHIRWMIRRNMPEVLAIEAESFEFPWMEEDFIHCLRGRNTVGMVAEHDDRIVGFMIYRLFKRKVELLNLAVARKQRRLSIGTQMMEKLKGRLSVQRRTSIVLRVQERNLRAQFFFHGMGFRASSVEKNYWDTGDDAYLMVHRLPQSVVDNDSESCSCRGEDAAHF